MPKLKKVQYFEVHAFGFPGHPFPDFFGEGGEFSKIDQAKRRAKIAISQGWRECQIVVVRLTADGVGIEKETIETFGLAV